MAEMWDSVAAAWEHNSDIVDAQMAPAMALLLDDVGIASGDAVLDVATGAGGAGIAAAGRVGSSGRVVLSDVAPAMVQAAARRAAGLSQVTTLVCDQLSIAAEDASFDAVISRHGLMFAEVPGDAVAEAVRVLRPGGRYGAIVWDAREANPWLGLILDAVSEQFGVPFPPPGIPGPFSLGDEDTFFAALTAGGLAQVRVTRISTPMRVTSLEAWWELVPQLAGPLAVALASLDAGVRDAIRERSMQLGAEVARDSDDGIETDGSVLVGTGLRAA